MKKSVIKNLQSNDVTVIKKFYPTVEECKINNLVRCTEGGCSNVFTSESNLTLHLAKTHKRAHLMESDLLIKQYHCPNLGCMYNKEKFFKNMKFLRQHYMKVHLTKDFNCRLCKKGFPTENALKNHIEYCGINFTCCDCQMSYTCYDTLKTHGRRKKHHILCKSEYKSNVIMCKSDTTIGLSKKSSFTLSKNSISCIVLPNLSKDITNQESQTVLGKPKLMSKMTQINTNVATISQNSPQTQATSKTTRLTVETQTIGDILSRKSVVDIFNDSNNHKNSNTQTDVVESRSISCNTSFNIDDFEFIAKADIKTNSLGTQTYSVSKDVFVIPSVMQDSINPNTSDLLIDSLNDNISNFEFDNCHMETQTDFLLEDELFSCNYYVNNMYTQTCDEILSDLCFSNIQTQTAIDDMLRSVESQTMMSNGKKNYTNCKDMTHMETQTDTEFRQMMEIINS